MRHLMTGQVHLEPHIAHNRGLPEHPPTVPREKRDWKAEKRNREEHRCGWAASLGPIRGTHREKVITKRTGSDRNERTQ